jgi:hypothetical protein
MKYLCLIYTDETDSGAFPAVPLTAICAPVNGRSARGRSICLIAAELEPTNTATTLRKRDGTLSTSAGPFAKTAEQLGGFVLIDAPNLDHAIQLATNVPAARRGSVELRPVFDVKRNPATSTEKEPSS